MSSTNLISKIAAGGLSAGVFLIWWPGHVGGEGISQLVVRGLLWTLSFELLLLAFAPLERLVTRAFKARFGSRRERLRARLDATPKPARTGGVVALASVGLVVPLLLLADTGKLPADTPDREVKVVKEIVVKRPIIKREVVVRPEIVNGPAPAPRQAQSPAPRVVERVVVKRTAPVTTTKDKAAAPAETQAPQPVTEAPQPAPDVESGTEQQQP